MSGELTSEHNKRLDRIEDKLDKLSDAIIALARAEEKINVIIMQLQTQSEAITTVRRRVELVENSVNNNKSTINIIHRLFWILMAAAATTITITSMITLNP